MPASWTCCRSSCGTARLRHPLPRSRRPGASADIRSPTASRARPCRACRRSCFLRNNRRPRPGIFHLRNSLPRQYSESSVRPECQTPSPVRRFSRRRPSEKLPSSRQAALRSIFSYVRSSWKMFCAVIRAVFTDAAPPLRLQPICKQFVNERRIRILTA